MSTAPPIVKNTRLNQHGVKNCADMWRTFNGEHYSHWTICPTPELIAKLRSAGVKCRRVGEELFVRHADLAAAAEADEG